MVDMKRILICSTILTTVKAFLIPHIQLLQDMGYIVDIAGQKDINELDGLVENVYDLPFQRNPFSKLNLIACRMLREVVQKNHYDLIHFHTPVASAFGRWAVKNFRKDDTKVIYTAHGFHFFMGAPLINWLLYYPVERWLARYTDVLITINKEDYARAKSFKAKKVEYVPGVGLNTKKFENVAVNKKEKCKELGLSDDAIVLLSVGELNKNKNHETVIKAVSKLKNSNVYYIICGRGPMENHLNNFAKKLGLEKQVKLLGFRTDIAEICKSADIFVFPSFREGLGLAALEAMASGLPIVTSNIHGIVDYSIDGVTGYTCSPTDVDGFVKNIDKLLRFVEKRLEMGAFNKEAVRKFDRCNVDQKMQEIYSKV